MFYILFGPPFVERISCPTFSIGWSVFDHCTVLYSGHCTANSTVSMCLVQTRILRGEKVALAVVIGHRRGPRPSFAWSPVAYVIRFALPDKTTTDWLLPLLDWSLPPPLQCFCLRDSLARLPAPLQYSGLHGKRSSPQSQMIGLHKVFRRKDSLARHQIHLMDEGVSAI